MPEKANAHHNWPPMVTNVIINTKRKCNVQKKQYVWMLFVGKSHTYYRVKFNNN